MDEDSLCEWEILPVPEAMKQEKDRSDSKKRLSDFVRKKEGQYVIELVDQSCPFLNKEGLCEIVSAYGEGCISQTCHTYPREKREYADRLESSLTLSCQSVVQLLFGRDAFNLIESETESSVGSQVEECPEYLYGIRLWFMQLAKDCRLELSTVMKVLFYLALDLKDRKVQSLEALSDYQQLGVDAQLIQMLEEGKLNPEDSDRLAEANELMLDLLIRYYEQQKYMEFVGPVYEAAVEVSQIAENPEKMRRLVQKEKQFYQEVYLSFESKIRNVLMEELWSSLLTSELTMDAILVKLEWLGIEMSVLRHWMFLLWQSSGVLTEETLVCIVSVLFRITGYCDADIFEYLEESFEQLIWDWGYMNLIL